jgi:hypothetical protein
MLRDGHVFGSVTRFRASVPNDEDHPNQFALSLENAASSSAAFGLLFEIY